jgi:HAD superfamily hydrolase (TIGR01509 family)
MHLAERRWRGKTVSGKQVSAQHVSRQYLSMDQRLFVPADTQAILWDLDGTLVDSFQFDLDVCGRIMSKHAGRPIEIPEQLLREGFALSGIDFWTFLFKSLAVSAEPQACKTAFSDWASERTSRAFALNEGVQDVLEAARRAGLRQAVVSNNPQQEVAQIVTNSGVLEYFDLIVGNDGSGRAKKPAPDSYLFAASRFGIAPGKCAAIEDSVLGLRAAHAAGTYAIGIASGVERFDSLHLSGLADVCYAKLSRCCITSAKNQSKIASVPSDDITALIAGLASATTALHVEWNNNNWALLGVQIGTRLSTPQTT